MTTQDSVISQDEPSQVVVEEKDVVVSKNKPEHVPVKKSITVKRKIKKSITVKRKIKKSATVKIKTSVKEVSGKSDHRYDFEEREEISEKRDNRGDREDKIQPEHGSNRIEPSQTIPQVHEIQPEHDSNRIEPSQIIPQVQEASEPDEMPVSTETSDEKSKAAPDEMPVSTETFDEKSKAAPDEMPVSTETSDEKSKAAPDEMPVSTETSDEKSKAAPDAMPVSTETFDEKSKAAPDEMPVSTETSDEKSKAAEKENEFWEALFTEKSEEDKTKKSNIAPKNMDKGAFADSDSKAKSNQGYLWQIFVSPERSSAKRFVIKKIDGTKKKPVQVQIEDLLHYRWFSCTESNYGWEWKFLPERKLKSIAYVRYMDEDPAIYGAYKCAANVITVRLEGRSCQYRPYYINKWIPLVLYPVQTGQDRRYWWGNFFIPIED